MPIATTVNRDEIPALDEQELIKPGALRVTIVTTILIPTLTAVATALGAPTFADATSDSVKVVIAGGIYLTIAVAALSVGLVVVADMKTRAQVVSANLALRAPDLAGAEAAKAATRAADEAHAKAEKDARASAAAQAQAEKEARAAQAAQAEAERVARKFEAAQAEAQQDLRAAEAARAHAEHEARIAEAALAHAEWDTRRAEALLSAERMVREPTQPLSDPGVTTPPPAGPGTSVRAPGTW